MEDVAAMPQGEWSSLTGMCFEEADFMAQFSIPNELLNDTNFLVSPTIWPTHRETAMYSCEETNTNMRISVCSGGSSFTFPEESYYSVTNNSLTTMDYYCTVEGKNDFLNQDVSNQSADCSNLELKEGLVVPLPRKDKIISPSKRPRVPCEVPRNKKIKFNTKFEDSDDDNNNNNNGIAVFQRQSSSNCCSEDESNGTASRSASKATRKTRAATDPQSLYARKRRERINERLKILQTLVPNGTKVDISTMLEEAVGYVKFLQLQIKLLSSDEHWMYAPIAYNGMDIGLDLKMAIPKPQ